MLLIVEVADTTLRYDREIKLPLYARHGIPEVWIVDPRQRRVEVCRKPQGTVYAETVSVQEHRTLAPAALPECRVEQSALF